MWLVGLDARRMHAVDAGLDAREVGGEDVHELQAAAGRKTWRVRAAAAEGGERVAPDHLHLRLDRPRIAGQPDADAEHAVDRGDVRLQYEVEAGDPCYIRRSARTAKVEPKSVMIRALRPTAPIP